MKAAPLVWSLSDAANVARLKTLLALRHLELHLITLGEAAEALGLDGGVVNEHIRSVLARDETEALSVIEPLHSSLFHYAPSSRNDLVMWRPSLYLFCPRVSGRKSGNVSTDGD